MSGVLRDENDFHLFIIGKKDIATMKQLNLSQRSADSYVNLSNALNTDLDQDLITWNNRLHTSKQNRSVLLQTPLQQPINSDLLSSSFYKTINSDDGAVWAFNHSATMVSHNESVSLSGWFDLIIRSDKSAKQTESYFQLYQSCSHALMVNLKISEGVFIDWVIQPATVEYEESENESLSAYIMRCCIELSECKNHKDAVKHMYGVTGLIAESIE